MFGNGDVAGRFPLVKRPGIVVITVIHGFTGADSVQIVQTILTGLYRCIASLSRNPGGIRGSCQELFYWS